MIYIITNSQKKYFILWTIFFFKINQVLINLFNTNSPCICFHFVTIKRATKCARAMSLGLRRSLLKNIDIWSTVKKWFSSLTACHSNQGFTVILFLIFYFSLLFNYLKKYQYINIEKISLIDFSRFLSILRETWAQQSIVSSNSNKF